MSRSKPVTICDCGCKKKAEVYELDRWLTLSQYPEQHRTAEPKIGREQGLTDDDEERQLQFATFACLARWVNQAVKIIPEMRKSAERINPRGGYHREDFPLLWF